MTAGLKKGSIYYEEDRKRYTFSVRIDGQRYVLHDRDEAQLIVKANELIERIESIPDFSVKKDVLLKDFVKLWLDRRKSTVTPKTYQSYVMHVNNYILPYLGDKKIIEIVNDDVQAFLNSIAAGNGCAGKRLSRNSLKHIRDTLRACLNYAIANKYIVSNPVYLAKIPNAKEKKEIVVLDLETLNNFLNTAKTGDYCYQNKMSQFQKNPSRDYLQSMYYNSIYFTSNVGTRYGETFALRWSDINWTKGTVTIRHNITESKGTLIHGLPKNKQMRTLKLKSKALAALKDWRIKYEQYVESCGDEFNNELDLVFPNSTGGFERESNFRKKCWLKLIDASGVDPEFTFHGLRHTHITMLLAAGVPVTDVSVRAGHSSPDVTMRFYAHVLQKLKDTCVDALEEMDF